MSSRKPQRDQNGFTAEEYEQIVAHEELRIAEELKFQEENDLVATTVTPIVFNDGNSTKFSEVKKTYANKITNELTIRFESIFTGPGKETVNDAFKLAYYDKMKDMMPDVESLIGKLKIK